MANEYCTVTEVKDILHSNQEQGKIKIISGSSVPTNEYSLNEDETERWINRAMYRVHTNIRRFLNPSLSLPITPLTSVPEEMKLATQYLSAIAIRTKVLAGHRMQDEIDSGVAEWKETVKELLIDLTENIKEGLYSSLRATGDVKIFYYNALPQWNSKDIIFTERAGVTNIGNGRSDDVDNTIVTPSGSDIWDDIFETLL